MEGHFLVLPIEHQGDLVLHLFQQPTMEALVFLLLPLLIMDFLHIDIQQRHHLKTFSYTGEIYNYQMCFIKFSLRSYPSFYEIIYYLFILTKRRGGYDITQTYTI